VRAFKDCDPVECGIVVGHDEAVRHLAAQNGLDGPRHLDRGLPAPKDVDAPVVAEAIVFPLNREDVPLAAQVVPDQIPRQDRTQGALEYGHDLFSVRHLFS
jgi:hypothetical protein